MTEALVSIPDVLDVVITRGSQASAGAPPDLIIELPHGATRTADYTSLAAKLTSPLPTDLVDFFHVNTDAGAPELAFAIARRLVTDDPVRTVAILRCLIPRTFIDCNRRMDASPEDFRAGKVTPGLMPWVTSPEDRVLLRERYDRYVAAVHGAIAGLPASGAMLMLHSYAPRTLGIEIDGDVVVKLRHAYLPEVQPTWPLRPEIDVISRTIDGTDHAPAGVVEVLRTELAAQGVAVAASVTYPLHPSTLALGYVLAVPGRAVCIEVRRDLLADPFEPFVQMRIGDAKIERLVPAFVAALRQWWR